MPASSPRNNRPCLGIDIGGTKCAVVMGTADGVVLDRIERATADGLSNWELAGPALSDMVDVICSRSSRENGQAAAMGISCGGPIDFRNGSLLNPPNLPGWHGAPIREFFAERFPQFVVHVENDANATALAEHRWGAGRGTQHMAYLTCGTGIGAGIILDGRLYRGATNQAGEIGHAVVAPGGPLCLCGKRGCLEALASGSCIGRTGADVFGIPEMTGRDVIDRAKEGDPKAQEIVDNAARFLGIGVANLLQTLNLQRVVIGSLAVYAGPEYLDRVGDAVRENTWQSIIDGVEIVASGLGGATQDLAALAIALPMEDYRPIEEQ